MFGRKLIMANNRIYKFFKCIKGVGQPWCLDGVEHAEHAGGLEALFEERTGNKQGGSVKDEQTHIYNYGVE